MSKAKQKSGKVVPARSTSSAAAAVKNQTPNRKPQSPKYKGEMLLPDEQKAVVSLERTIDKALAEFVNVGLALTAC